MTLLLALLHLWPVTPLQATRPTDVRYRLEAAVDDRAGLVEGTGEIRYRHQGSGVVRSLTFALGSSVVSELRVDGGPPAALEAVGVRRDTAQLTLPRPLVNGDSVVLTFSWTSRPSPRDHRLPGDRRLELSAWYPRLIDHVAESTVPSPAFATVLLRLELPEDQVVGGTGVPMCGDPGWRAAAAFPDTRVTLQRGWYATPRDPAAGRTRCDAPFGRKVVTWYAEDVTDLALAMSPTFRYEEGDFLERPVHTLYESGEERVWGAGLATRRTEAGLAWIFELGGRYPWPQLTVVQGLTRPGHALSMVIFAAEPTQAAILNLLGLLATEQVMTGGARVFTVGTAAYQAAWFFEVLGRRGSYARIEREILDWDLDGRARHDEPLAPPTSTTPCATTYCRRTEFMSYQLRRWAGSDEAMRNLYHSLYAHFLLQPTSPGAFQQIAGELIRPSPNPLYEQLPRGGTLYDDAITSARRERLTPDRWRTTVVIERRERGRFPQVVWVVADSDTAVARASALSVRETLVLVSRTRPRRVLLDPLAESHDWNMLNNQRTFGFHPGWLVLTPNRPRDGYLDTYFARHTARDRLTLGWAPAAWYNDAGGWTLAGRVREDYLGRFELNEGWLSLGTGWGADSGRTQVGGRLAIRNPVALRATGWKQELTAAWEEGRAAAGLRLERQFPAAVLDSTARSLALSLRWLTVTDDRYLDRGYYDDAGSVELELTGRLRRTGTRWPVAVTATAGGGRSYPNSGSTLGQATYGRFSLEGSLRGPTDRRLALGVRVFAGAIASGADVPRQRRIYLAGADPLARFDSPFLRSRGALLTDPDVHYHLPGGGGLRGMDSRLSGTAVLGTTAEVEYTVVFRKAAGIFHRFVVAGFVDGALANGDLDPGGDRLVGAGDAGIGLRGIHRLGRTWFQTRLDFPIWISRPELAQDDSPSAPLGFRWSFSFQPSF